MRVGAPANLTFLDGIEWKSYLVTLRRVTLPVYKRKKSSDRDA